MCMIPSAPCPFTVDHPVSCTFSTTCVKHPVIWQVQKLKEQEAEDGISSRPRRPKALILGPTRELTDQILRVAKSISHHAKFRSTCVNGGVA